MSASDNIFAKAHGAHRSGKLKEAEVGYRRVLRTHPRHPDALHFLGMLQFQRGARDEGLTLVRGSLAALPTNPHAWNNLGNMLMTLDQPQDAADAYAKATELGPDMAEAWCNRAICLRRVRHYDEAITCFTKAVELKPVNNAAYERLGMLLYNVGRFPEAAGLYRRWLEHEPGNALARHMLAAMTGKDVPARADDQYVKELFDGFASSFDENLASLGYRAPELLSSALGEYVPTDGRLDILDAGCGTGLCGPLLRSTANRLLGVDISDGMVTKARERNVYDELVVAELCEFMRSRPASVDVILSADTLVYFGALEEACAAARQCLRPNGLFAFTVERLEQAVDNTAVDSSQGAPPDIQPPLSFHLQPHGRYAHSATYVESTLRQAGFAEVHRRDVVLRRELGHDVHGHLVVGRVS